MPRITWFCAIAVLAALTAGTASAGDLVVNGTFEGGFVDVGLSDPNDGLGDNIPVAWNRYETFTGGGLENSQISPFAGNGPSAPGVSSVDFQRLTPPNASGDFTSIYQNLSVTASHYHALNLALDIQVNTHDLVAGGWVSPAFEWPVVVQVAYTDTTDTTQIWRFGWYLENPGDGARIDDPGSGLIPIYRDLMVPQNVWVANTFNLLAELPQAKTIDQVLVGGSGWVFQGKADNVSISGTLAVPIDIKPGGLPNSINLLSKGVIPVAILGSEWLNVEDIDPASLLFANSAAREAGKSGKIASFEDVNGDGFLDMILHFPTQELTGLDAESLEAVLTGLMKDGTPLYGSDSVRILDKPDANLDGVVDGVDFSLLKASFGLGGPWERGDFNEDGIIDSVDFTLLKAQYGEGTPPGGTIPEPATLSLLGVCGVLLLKRRGDK